MAAFVIFLFAFFVFTILRGASLDVFWDWFIVGPDAPFQTLPGLTFAQALGLSLVVSFLTYQSTADTETDDDATEAAVKAVAKGLVYYTVIWFVAIIYKGLM